MVVLIRAVPSIEEDLKRELKAYGIIINRMKIAISFLVRGSQKRIEGIRAAPTLMEGSWLTRGSQKRIEGQWLVPGYLPVHVGGSQKRIEGFEHIGAFPKNALVEDLKRELKENN